MDRQERFAKYFAWEKNRPMRPTSIPSGCFAVVELQNVSDHLERRSLCCRNPTRVGSLLHLYTSVKIFNPAPQKQSSMMFNGDFGKPGSNEVPKKVEFVL